MRSAVTSSAASLQCSPSPLQRPVGFRIALFGSAPRGLHAAARVLAESPKCYIKRLRQFRHLTGVDASAASQAVVGLRSNLGQYQARCLAATVTSRLRCY